MKMDTETRIDMLEKRIQALENLVEEMAGKAKAIVARLETNPMFAPLIRMIRG